MVACFPPHGAIASVSLFVRGEGTVLCVVAFMLKSIVVMHVVLFSRIGLGSSIR
jgi:hypothetical protein